MRRRRAIVLGFEYHARYLARVMNRHSPQWEFAAYSNTRLGTVRALLALRRADALICFGGPGPNVALSEAAAARGVPVVVIWAGSDVLIAAESPFDMAVIERRGYHNAAVAPWLVDELRALGVTAAWVPVGAMELQPRVAPLPQRFRVLTYLPHPRRSFYGEQRVYRIARAMPDVEFAVLGAGEADPHAPENVAFAGYVHDAGNELDASTVLLRLTDHDGMSVLVLEALAHARHVVWTHELPGVHAVCDEDRALAVLQRLAAEHAAGTLRPNAIGRAFVGEHYAAADVARGIERFVDGVLESSMRAHPARKRRAAISGLGLFSAEVAKQVERRSPAWNVHVLRTGSRLEVLSALYNLLRSDVWYSIGSPITDRWVHLWARMLRKPRIVHWVGSDIEHARNADWVRRQMQSRRVKHLTEVAWTADELRALGLESEIVPLPLRQHSTGVTPLPERFTVLLYIPKARPEFYGRSEYEAVLQEFAGEPLRVFVVGGAELRAPESIEVVNLGWRGDLHEVYQQSTVLVRLTPRDGLSLMVLEALSFGRFVMWSKPFPYATQIGGRRDMIDGLRTLLARHRAGTLHAQYAAAEMVARSYGSERSIDRILNAWEVVT